MESLITVRRADELLGGAIIPSSIEEVHINEAHGRTLCEAVTADRDQPPFHRVTMDGIAFQSGAFGAGRRRFLIVATQRAGATQLTLDEPGGCIEVMTGAVLPEGCDCVVPIEQVAVRDGTATLSDDCAAAPMQCVHLKGSDYRAGAVLLAPGTRLGAPEVAVAASAGCGTLRVSRIPRIAVVTTGDELVDVGASPAPYQIRRSNDAAIAAALRLRGFERTETHHVPDNTALLTRTLAQLLETSDMVLITGGVSMGKFDYIPQVLHALKVEALFHKVKQRPGKPLLFGVASGGQVVFGLPGNPISALVCLRRYVVPQLEGALDRKTLPPERAALAASVAFKPELTWFLPVCVSSDADGRLLAEPRPGNTSGDFASLAGTDGFLELDAERQEFPEGHAAPLYRWDA